MRDYLHHHLSDRRQIDEVVLCIEEACTNAIRHSGSSEDIALSLGLHADHLHVVVLDRGRGFDPELLRRAAPPDPTATGGRGLLLMTRLINEVELRLDGGTEIRMKKSVQLADEDRRLVFLARETGVESPHAPGDVSGRLEGVLESLTDGFVAIDWEWRYIYANPPAVQMLRLPADTLLGGTVWALFPEAVGSEFEERYRQAMEQGIASRFEFLFPPHETWYELRVYPAAFGISVYFVDITERKRKELERDRLHDELQRVEERFQATFEQAAVGLAHVSANGRFLLVNDRLSDITGYSRDELLGMSFVDITYPDDLDLDLAKARALLAGEIATYSLDKRYVRKDGAIRWVSLTRSLVRDQRGEPDFFVTVMEDIQQRRQAEEALRESEAKYRTLYESVDEGFFLIDVIFDADDRPVDLLYVETNAAAMKMLGVDYTGRRLTEISPGYEPYWFEIFGNVAKTGQSVRLERYAEPDNRWYDFFVFKMGGAHKCRVGNTFKDVTERKRREANLAFLAGITDDFSRLSTEDELVQSVGRRAGEHLQLSRLYLLAIDEEKDLATVEHAWRIVGRPDIRGAHTLSDFVATDLRQAADEGAAIVIGDTQTDSRVDPERCAALGIGSFIAVPFDRQDEWEYLLVVDDSSARHWRRDEIELVEELTKILVPRLERARVESRLRESQERLHQTVRAAGAGMWEWDVMTDAFVWSTELFELFGLDPARVTASLQIWDEVLHPDDRDRSYARIADALREHTELSSEYRILRDGEVRWIHALGRGAYDERGEPLRVSGICIDITERKRLEERLAAKERQARHLIQNAPAAIFEVDFRSSSFLSVNDYMSELAGYSRAELMAMDPVRLLAEEDRPVFIERMRRTLAGENTKSVVEYGFVTKWGEERRAVLNVTPLMKDDVPIGAFVVAHDVTERTHAEEALRASERRYRNLFESLQKGFVHPLPDVRGLELAALSLPAYRPELIGGDFHDVFILPDGRILAFIGDVMGKGINAAGLTETVRSAARAVSLSLPSPDQILNQLNRLLLAEEHEQFVSLLLLVLDPESGSGLMASAGHPPAIRLGTGEPECLEPRYGPLLGLLEESYVASSFTLAKGESLLLYTDGVTEAHRGRELYGERRLLESLAAAPDPHPEALVTYVRDDVLAYAGELRDDLQVLALRRL